MFTMVNTLNKKQIQQVQELKLTDCKNLENETQCVKPQIRVHWNKVPKRRDIKRSKVLSLSSKVRVLLYYVPAKLTALNMMGPYTIFHIPYSWQVISKPIFSKQEEES